MCSSYVWTQLFLLYYLNLFVLFVNESIFEVQFVGYIFVEVEKMILVIIKKYILKLKRCSLELER